jgi:hypothetical protein
MRALAVAILTLCACKTSPLAIPEDMATTPVDLSHLPLDKVDVLFVIDDTAGAGEQANLRQRIPDLIEGLDGLAVAGHPASYHFGVVTSSLGAPGISCGKDLGAKLQQVGRGAAPGCKGPVGANFVRYDQAASTNNLPAGQDLPTTLGCMLDVGDIGCGFEMTLEAGYRALHDPIPENAGFLRHDALLVIVYLTDEDDCSVDPASDLFTANPAYGPLTSFRCTRFGIFCDGALVADAAPMSYASCTPATPAEGSKLTDLNKYINFLTQPDSKGGVKDDPRDVLVAAIAAPPAPFATEAGTGPEICDQGTTTCTLLSHSCVSPDATFFGNPAVRLNAVVESAPNHLFHSMCDLDYGAPMQALAARIGAALQ